MISGMYIAGSKMVHLEVHNQIQVSTRILSLDNELPFLISFRIRATFTGPTAFLGKVNLFYIIYTHLGIINLNLRWTVLQGYCEGAI